MQSLLGRTLCLVLTTKALCGKNMKSINTVTEPKKLDVSSFWNTDLSTLEKQFLKDRDVSTLPIHLDERVPPQGSVILDRTTQPKRKIFDYLCDIFK